MKNQKSKVKAPARQKSTGQEKTNGTTVAKDYFSVSDQIGTAEQFPIVAIGASAGGLKAFEQFFTHMPSDSGMAFIVITHLDPTHKSILSDIIRRYTKMQVVEIQDGMRVTRDWVYVIPPNKSVSIEQRILRLIKLRAPRGLRHPIDLFFRSLAEDVQDRAIGVVFSGTGTEGALGIRAIKGAGGLAIVQKPESAEYAGMPESAIATGNADFVLPPDRIAEQLLKYGRNSYVALTGGLAPPERIQSPLETILSLIRTRTGNDFSRYKQNTVIRRIEKRMAMHAVKNMEDYSSYLRNNPVEVDVLMKELLIRVTGFFRDAEAFEALKAKALPLIFKDLTRDEPIRIWVPGCSTGEEAYSIAMLVYEYMQDEDRRHPIQIFATDIDTSAIEIARAGFYSDSIEVDVTPNRLSRFFIPQDSRYKIRETIREMVVFAVHNLVKDAPFSRLHLVICRNLLIYLGSDLQKKVIPLLRYSLNPGGILFLGSSETIGDFSSLFDAVDQKWRIFKARNMVSAPVPPVDIRATKPRTTDLPREDKATVVKPGKPHIEELTEQFLLSTYAPPCVIVNERGDILYFFGKTGMYLEPAAGKAAFNITEMARKGLRLELRTALRKAIDQKKDMIIEGLQVKTNGSFRTINLEVRKIKEPEHFQGLFIVVFNEKVSAPGKRAAQLRSELESQMKQNIADLELDLKATRENLRSMVEELETSNEELKSTNEELQSSNEELRSTNEELETSREELQSLNGELRIVNAELQTKIDELSTANNDMANLLAGTRVAIIFLDNMLRIKSYTPEAVSVINLISADVGRPLGDIASKLEYPDLISDAQEVIRTHDLKERTVRRRDGAWFFVRILPYRTGENVIQGAIISFLDVTLVKKTQAEVEAALIYKGVVETVREPLVVLDGDLRVLYANSSFYRFFNVSPPEIEHKVIYELGNRQWDIPELRELLEKILPENARFQDFAVEREFPGVGRRKMLLNARMIFHDGMQTRTILLAMEDVTNVK